MEGYKYQCDPENKMTQTTGRLNKDRRKWIKEKAKKKLKE